MTRQEFLKDYWQYYLMLEKQFVNTLQYVDLDNNNFTTFSNQYHRNEIPAKNSVRIRC